MVMVATVLLLLTGASMIDKGPYVAWRSTVQQGGHGSCECDNLNSAALSRHAYRPVETLVVLRCVQYGAQYVDGVIKQCWQDATTLSSIPGYREEYLIGGTVLHTYVGDDWSHDNNIELHKTTTSSDERFCTAGLPKLLVEDILVEHRDGGCPWLKIDDESAHRRLQVDQADRITVVNPKMLPASLAVNRTKLLGLRGDYKPYITQLATGELLMVHRCEAILSSPPRVMNAYQDCPEDHLVLWRGTATGDSWNRTQHVAVAAPHKSADILGGEFSVQTLTDGTVFLHSGGCQYYRSTDHARSFTASNSSWNCTLCSGPWCGGGGSSYNVIEVKPTDATETLPPGLYFFAHIHVYRSIDNGVSFQLHVSASVVSNGQWDMRGGDSFFEQTGTPFLTKAGVLVNVPRVGVRSDWDETDGSQLWASTNGGRDWSCRTNAAGNFCANNNLNFSCMNNVSYSCSSTHSGDRRSFGGPGDMYSHMLRLHDGRTLLTWTKRCSRATDFILRSINEPANAPCRDDGHGTGLRAILTDERALDWDWQSDYMILTEQSDLYSDISGSGCECGYGNTIQLRGSDTLVTVYSYANATEINTSIATDHGTGLHRGFGSHIGVMRWRLPSVMKTDDAPAVCCF